MLTKRYLIAVKNLPQIMQKIVDGTAPEKFNLEHLQGLGFKSSSDRAIIPILKDLKFLAADGTPTARYHEYRDKSQSRRVMAEALREAYEDLFHLNAHPTDADRAAIHGKFRSAHNVSDDVAEKQTATFYALLKLADLGAPAKKRPDKGSTEESTEKQSTEGLGAQSVHLRYNIEVHLPATKDVDVYNAIFKSLKSHLLG